MKKLIALAALMVAFSANAYDCENLSKYAVEVMTKRQNEDSIVEVIKTAKDDVERRVVLAAYQKPSFSTPKWKSKAIKEFSNDVTTVCYANSM